MKKSRKKYKKPLVAWDKERIERERELLKTYGLTEKKEILKTEGLLRKFRRMARELAAKRDKEREKALIEKLMKLNLLPENAGLDDVLGLTLENMFERRLETVLFRKGLANTPRQARQFIVHGKVIINERKISYPSYLVKKNEEEKIQVVK
jgi:small subunit ribosomal protein S4